VKREAEFIRPVKCNLFCILYHVFIARSHAKLCSAQYWYSSSVRLSGRLFITCWYRV